MCVDVDEDWPLAGAEHPGRDEPEADCEHHEHGARADRHERLDHEARVEVDPGHTRHTSHVMLQFRMGPLRLQRGYTFYHRRKH